MNYKFTLADHSALQHIYTLIDKRIEWMDKMGIQQWNVTNYWEVYPKNYYINELKNKNLYVLKRNKDEAIIGAVVIFDVDVRWKDDYDVPAYYIHNFVTDINEKGAGKFMLKCIQELAINNNKICLRLDCATSNKNLNDYYKQEGFVLVGQCIDGNYFGNKREKRFF